MTEIPDGFILSTTPSLVHEFQLRRPGDADVLSRQHRPVALWQPAPKQIPSQYDLVNQTCSPSDCFTYQNVAFKMIRRADRERHRQDVRRHSACYYNMLRPLRLVVRSYLKGTTLYTNATSRRFVEDTTTIIKSNQVRFCSSKQWNVPVAGVARANMKYDMQTHFVTQRKRK